MRNKKGAISIEMIIWLLLGLLVLAVLVWFVTDKIGKLDKDISSCKAPNVLINGNCPWDISRQKPLSTTDEGLVCCIPHKGEEDALKSFAEEFNKKNPVTTTTTTDSNKLTCESEEGKCNLEPTGDYTIPKVDLDKTCPENQHCYMFDIGTGTTFGEINPTGANVAFQVGSNILKIGDTVDVTKGLPLRILAVKSIDKGSKCFISVIEASPVVGRIIPKEYKEGTTSDLQTITDSCSKNTVLELTIPNGLGYHTFGKTAEKNYYFSAVLPNV